MRACKGAFSYLLELMSKFRLNKLARSVDRAINDSLSIMGKDAKIFFEDSFKKEGFTDERFEKWQPRKGQIRGGLGAALKVGHKNTKPTLTDTRKLRKSLKLLTHFKRAIIETTIPYAAVHNEGLRTGRGRGVKMPKRKFMGNSKTLEKRMLAKLTAKIETAILNA